MDEPPSPTIAWCGGVNADQDVSIRLVPNEINQQQVTNLSSRGPLAVLKVHSTRLEKHSKYFQVCLSNRWTQPAPPSNRKELSLELIHGLQVASYIDCLSRMYTPLRQNFKGIKSSLDLLRVASQIEFLDLVNSICRYLSTIHWTEEDELRIRRFSSFTDFPHSQAEGLVARLHIGEQGNEDDRRELLRGQIVHSFGIALRRDNIVHREKLLGAQSFFEDFFSSLGQSEIDSAFDVDVVTIVIEEVKDLLESFCRKHTTFDELSGETVVVIEMGFVDGPDFRRKFKGLCWALEILLTTQMAEEVIQCLLNLEFFVEITLEAWSVDSDQPASKNIAFRFTKLLISVFQEVFAGRLLLEIPDRVLLIERWQFLNAVFDLETQDDYMILLTEEFGKTVEGVFLTLPLEQQLELLQRDRIFPQRFICTASLMTLMKRNWPAAEEDALLQAEGEVDGV